MRGRTVNPGKAVGEALVSRSPLSFYGGVDPKSGVVVERGHELEGKSVKGKILVFPRGKGSTVGSYVIYALKRNGAAPLAVVNEETEPIVAAGVILADIPCVDKVDLNLLETGDLVEVDANRGRVEVLRKRR